MMRGATTVIKSLHLCLFTQLIITTASSAKSADISEKPVDLFAKSSELFGPPIEDNAKKKKDQYIKFTDNKRTIQNLNVNNLVVQNVPSENKIPEMLGAEGQQVAIYEERSKNKHSWHLISILNLLKSKSAVRPKHGQSSAESQVLFQVNKPQTIVERLTFNSRKLASIKETRTAKSSVLGQTPKLTAKSMDAVTKPPRDSSSESPADYLLKLNLLTQQQKSDAFWAMASVTFLLVVICMGVCVTKLWKRRDEIWEDLEDPGPVHDLYRPVSLPKINIHELLHARTKYIPLLKAAVKKKKSHAKHNGSTRDTQRLYSNTSSDEETIYGAY